MAEFEGSKSSPKGLGESAANAASASTESIAEYLKQNLDEARSVNMKLASIADVVTARTPNMESSGNVDANTAALLSLTETIKSAKISIDGGGDFDANFFTSLISLTSSDKKINRIHKFAQAFHQAASLMGSAQSFVPGINAVTTAMAAAAQPIASLAKSSLMFAGGLALLGFTLVTFIEAVTIEDLFKFGLIIGTIALASRMMKGSAWDIAKVSVGIATLGLTVWAFNELITFKMGAQFVATTMLIMGGLALASKIAGTIGKNVYKNILMSSLAIAALSGSVYVFSQAMDQAKTVDLAKAAQLGLVIAGYGIGFNFLGSMTGSIIKGAVAAAAIGGGLWVLAKGLDDLNQIDMSLSRSLELAAMTVGAAGILTLIGNPVTIGFTLAGAAATAAIGGALLLLATGMNVMSTVNITPEQAANFKRSADILTDTFVDFASPLKLPFMIVGMAQAALVAGSTLAMSGAIALVSKLNIAKPEKFEAFKNGAIALSDIFADFGSPWKLVKVTVGAGMATLVAGATVATALGIAAFTKVVSSPGDVTRATESLDLFIGGVEGALVGREGSFPAIAKGVNSFMGLSNMVREVADSAQAIGNLEFVEKEVQNGKLVVKSVRKFTPEDFNRIGTSVGMILSALTEPLAAIGGSQDSFTIGGFTVTNPFSNKVQKGVEAMSNIGMVFTPLASILDVFAKNNINEAFIQNFNKNLGILLGGISSNFMGFNSVDDESLEKLGVGTKHLNSLIWNVSKDKFGTGVTHFEKMAGSITTIKESINSMNLDKLSKFNELIFNIKASVETDALEELVDVFSEFVEELADQLGSIASNTRPVEKTSQTNDEQTTSINKLTDAKILAEEAEKKESQIDMSEVTDKLSDIALILRTQTLKVKMKEQF